MKCAVAIVLALIGLVVANPAPVGLGYASPFLLPSAVSVSSSLINHGYGKVVAPVIAPIIKPISVPIVKTVPIIRTPVLSVPLTIGYPGVGYGWGGLGYGGYGGLGYGYGGLGWGKGGLGWGGVGLGKGWH